MICWLRCVCDFLPRVGGKFALFVTLEQLLHKSPAVASAAACKVNKVPLREFFCCVCSRPIVCATDSIYAQVSRRLACCPVTDVADRPPHHPPQSVPSAEVGELCAPSHQHIWVHKCLVRGDSLCACVCVCGSVREICCIVCVCVPFTHAC